VSDDASDPTPRPRPDPRGFSTEAAADRPVPAFGAV